MSAAFWVMQPTVFPWFAFTLGLCVGSFLNVVVHRLPKMMERDWHAQCVAYIAESEEAAGRLVAGNAATLPAERYNLVAPRSACPGCGHRITALENIPVLSWIALRGKCSACGMSISLRYPVVELSAGVLAALSAIHFGPGVAAIGAMLFAWSLLALALIDLDTQLLPDDITLPLLWAGLLANLWGVFTPLTSAVIGATAGYLSLWTVFWAFKLATGKEGMGYGDFKLFAAIGAWLGWKVLPIVILASSVVGAVVGLSMMISRKHGRDVPIPFGPYLAAAGLIGMYWGDDLMRRWMAA
jgi:leader peptidase (prepilin peptidase)/N-methyltransferase